MPKINQIKYHRHKPSFITYVLENLKTSFKIIKEGDLSVSFSSGTLGAGSVHAPSDVTISAGTDTTRKIIMGYKSISGGYIMPLPYIEPGVSDLVESISLYYDPSTDTIIVRRRIQNFDLINSVAYAAETFNCKWYLLAEPIT
ncbi:MAG: hypothetical protein AABY22_28795 [Nanoarchaeota archaeon]